MWKSENNLQELAFLFHYWTQVVELGSQAGTASYFSVGLSHWSSPELWRPPYRLGISVVCLHYMASFVSGFIAASWFFYKTQVWQCNFRRNLCLASILKLSLGHLQLFQKFASWTDSPVFQASMDAIVVYLYTQIWTLFLCVMCHVEKLFLKWVPSLPSVIYQIISFTPVIWKKGNKISGGDVRVSGDMKKTHNCIQMSTCQRHGYMIEN